MVPQWLHQSSRVFLWRNVIDDSDIYRDFIRRWSNKPRHDSRDRRIEPAHAAHFEYGFEL
jgi:hypothetical protein